MCAKIPKMSAGMGQAVGFGLDVLGRVGTYKDEQRLTADENRNRQQQNQLKINAYNTKNRNAENVWNNNKLDSDAKVDQKWRETIDAIAEAQLQARKAAGDAAISQQRALVGMMNASAGREQGGRRTGGRAKYLENAAKFAQASFNAAFSRDQAALFTTKASKTLSAFAAGEHVSYITGRPSPGAPPIMQPMKRGPSFFNTAIGILGDGLGRYKQWQDNKAPDAYNKNRSSMKIGNLPSNYKETEAAAFAGAEAWQQEKALREQFNPSGISTMEVSQYTSPVFNDNFLQTELDDYFDTKLTTNWEQNLGIDFQDSFGVTSANSIGGVT